MNGIIITGHRRVQQELQGCHCSHCLGQQGTQEGPTLSTVNKADNFLVYSKGSSQKPQPHLHFKQREPGSFFRALRQKCFPRSRAEGLGMGEPVCFYPCSALHHWEPQGLCGWCLLSHDLLQCKSTYIKLLDLCLDIFLLHIVPSGLIAPLSSHTFPSFKSALSHTLLHNPLCFPHCDAEIAHPPPW